MKDFTTIRAAKKAYHAGLITQQQLKEAKASIYAFNTQFPEKVYQNRAMRRGVKTGIAGPRKLIR